MLLNGAIDLDLYYIDFKTDFLNKEDRQLDIKDCVAFALKNLGNVPISIDNTIIINSGNCNARTFPNYLGLRYGVNKNVVWFSDGVVDPEFRVELTRIYLIKKKLPEISNG